MWFEKFQLVFGCQLMHFHARFFVKVFFRWKSLSEKVFSIGFFWIFKVFRWKSFTEKVFFVGSFWIFGVQRKSFNEKPLFDFWVRTKNIELMSHFRNFIPPYKRMIPWFGLSDDPLSWRWLFFSSQKQLLQAKFSLFFTFRQKHQLRSKSCDFSTKTVFELDNEFAKLIGSFLFFFSRCFTRLHEHRDPLCFFWEIFFFYFQREKYKKATFFGFGAKIDRFWANCDWKKWARKSFGKFFSTFFDLEIARKILDNF